jgi:hypothetical protein
MVSDTMIKPARFYKPTVSSFILSGAAAVIYRQGGHGVTCHSPIMKNNIQVGNCLVVSNTVRQKITLNP